VRDTKDFPQWERNKLLFSKPFYLFVIRIIIIIIIIFFIFFFKKKKNLIKVIEIYFCTFIFCSRTKIREK